MIPDLASETSAPKFLKTRVGMLKLAKEIVGTKPQTIVIASPHSLRLWRKIGIVTAENSSGKLRGPRRNGNFVSLKVKCDREFAKELLTRAMEKHLPVVGANYGSFEGSSSDMPMDWGTLIPLWFVMRRSRKKPKVVIVTPSREIPLSQNYEFGRVIAHLAESKSTRCVFIASADQAHAHRKSGPYGFSKAASEYDQLVLEAIRRNRIDAVMKLRADFVKNAKPDSLWQMTMLAGALSRVPMRSQLFSYQVPTYYGMICAGFRRET